MHPPFHHFSEMTLPLEFTASVTCGWHVLWWHNHLLWPGTCDIWVSAWVLNWIHCASFKKSVSLSEPQFLHFEIERTSYVFSTLKLYILPPCSGPYSSRWHPRVNSCLFSTPHPRPIPFPRNSSWKLAKGLQLSLALREICPPSPGPTQMNDICFGRTDKSFPGILIKYHTIRYGTTFQNKIFEVDCNI